MGVCQAPAIRVHSRANTGAPVHGSPVTVFESAVVKPLEYAPLVAFLCGEPAGYVTGQTISIDGGLTAGLFG